MDVELYICRPDGVEGSFAKFVVKSSLERNGNNFKMEAKSTITFDSGKTQSMTEATPPDGYPLPDDFEELQFQHYKDKDCTFFNSCWKGSKARQLPKSRRKRCFINDSGKEQCDGTYECWDTDRCWTKPRYNIEGTSCWKDPNGGVNKDNWISTKLEEAYRHNGMNEFTRKLLFVPGLITLAAGDVHVDILSQKIQCVALRRKRAKMNANLPRTGAGGELRMPLPWKIQKVFKVGFMEVAVHAHMHCPVPTLSSASLVDRHPRSHLPLLPRKDFLSTMDFTLYARSRAREDTSLLNERIAYGLLPLFQLTPAPLLLSCSPHRFGVLTPSFEGSAGALKAAVKFDMEMEITKSGAGEQEEGDDTDELGPTRCTETLKISTFEACSDEQYLSFKGQPGNRGQPGNCWYKSYNCFPEGSKLMATLVKRIQKGFSRSLTINPRDQQADPHHYRSRC